MGEALKDEVIEQITPLDYLNIMHGNSKGWITKAEINNSFRQWHYKYSDLKEQDYSKQNTYISVNTFYSTYRRIEYLKEIKSLFIDLDIYKTKLTKEQVLWQLNEDYFNKSIPVPNLIIDSGRGLYLIWNTNTVPSQALPLWKAIEEYLYKELKDFGADRQALDATRILRVPGSINSKSKSMVKVIECNNYMYELREIQNNFLPELTPNNEKKKGRPKKIVFVHRERSLYYARIQDITKLCELREYDLKGHRELILFLYRYWLCYFTEDTKKALNDALELNSMFVQPLSENEVIRATRSAETVFISKDKQYKYKNETLIDLLEITEYEETFMTTIISKNEYKRRDRIYQKKKYDSDKAKIKYKEKLKAEDKISEKDKISQRRAKIIDLLAEGLKQKDICLALDISKITYKRDRKFLKEQGLI